MSLGQPLIEKGKALTQKLVLEGEKIDLDLHFSDREERGETLLSILFNGRVVWEEYLKDNIISLNIETKIGDNMLQVIPVNRSVKICKFSYCRSDGTSHSQEQRSIN